jgi:DNA-binding LytR/AlgR family response regulator
VHRSYIVPRDAVVAVRHAGGSVVVEPRPGATIPVSRRRRGTLARFVAAVHDTAATTRDSNAAR